MKISQTLPVSALIIGSGASIVACGVYYTHPSDSLTSLSADLLDASALFNLNLGNLSFVNASAVTSSKKPVRLHLPQLVQKAVRHQEAKNCKYWFSFGNGTYKSLKDKGLTESEKIAATGLFYKHSKNNECAPHSNVYFHQHKPGQWGIATHQVPEDMVLYMVL